MDSASDKRLMRTAHTRSTRENSLSSTVQYRPTDPKDRRTDKDIITGKDIFARLCRLLPKGRKNILTYLWYIRKKSIVYSQKSSKVKKYESDVETTVGRCGRSDGHHIDELVQTVSEGIEGNGHDAQLQGALTTDREIHRRDLLHRYIENLFILRKLWKAQNVLLECRTFANAFEMHRRAGRRDDT